MRLNIIVAVIFLFSCMASLNAPAQTRPAAVAAPVGRSWVEPPMPTTPGDHKLKFRAQIDGHTIELAYLLHLPANYDKNIGSYPMLMFLHGSGEAGTDLAGIYAWGPEQLLKSDDGDPQFSSTCPFIILSPQCPPHGERWDQEPIIQCVVKLLDHVMTKVRVDPDRVYCTGLSMGGTGTWEVALAAPDRFAAIAPISATKVEPELAAKVLNYVSVWSINGGLDYITLPESNVMIDALKNSRMEVRHSVLLNQGHEVWIATYNNPQFYEWLLSKRRPSPAQKKILDQQFAQFGKTFESNPPLPTKPGHYLLWADTKIGDQNERLDYVLYLPRNYTPHGAKSPVLLFEHELHSMGQDVNDICLHGPDAELEKKENAALAQNFPFVVISPLRPIAAYWEQRQTGDAMIALVKDLAGKLNIDSSHVCITGQDYGASGAWETALAAPNYFSSMALVCDKENFVPKAETAAALVHLPVWVSIAHDQTPSIDGFKTIFSHSKAPWKINDLTAHPYANAELYTWLLQQHRAQLAETSR
jgi:predicted peptidase